jgi:amidohydrolase
MARVTKQLVESVVQAVEAHREAILKTFEDLHAIPEPGFQEHKTSTYLKTRLEEAGIPVKELTETGFIAELAGSEPGPSIGLRADMDALPFKNEKGETFYSHGCGHDANSTMVLWAMLILKKLGLVKRGKIRAIFQPAEETLFGAEKMAKAGAVEGLDELYGVHLRPIQEARLGQATPALWHGGAATLEITIRGKPAHGARPHLGVNAIVGAALAVLAANAIWLDPTQPWSIAPTMISGGTAHNTIPDKVTLVVNLRAKTNKLMEELISKLKTACEGATAAIGASVEFKLLGSVPGADYDKESVENLAEAIKEVLGPEGLIEYLYTSGSEDFHVYKQMYPQLKTAYLGVGADLTPGLHNPNITFNKEALIIGVKILTIAVARRLLSE